MYKYILLYGKLCNKMFPVGIIYLGCMVLLYHLHLDATRGVGQGVMVEMRNRGPWGGA